jgi:hypothetical protein
LYKLIINKKLNIMKKLLLSFGIGLLAFTGNAQQVVFQIQAPAQYAGTFTAGTNADFTWADSDFWDGSGGTQSWGTPNLLVTPPVQDTMVILEGGDPIQHGNCTFDQACSGVGAVTNAAALNGQIALIRRGSCEFGSKALAAQDAGAVAAIIITPTATPINMGGGTDGANVTIPVIMVSSAVGDILCDAVTAGTAIGYIGVINYANNLKLSSDYAYIANRAVDMRHLYDGTGAVDSIKPGLLVENVGDNTQHNVVVSCNITKNGTNVYSQTQLLDSLSGVTVVPPSGDNIWIDFPPYVLAIDATTDDKYELTYTVSSDSTDEEMQDNSLSSIFRVLEGRFAYAQMDDNGNAFAGGDAAGRAETQELSLCNHFYDANANNASYPATGIKFQMYSYDPVLATTLELLNVKLELLEWQNITGIYDFTDPNYTSQWDDDVANDTNKFIPLNVTNYQFFGDYQDSVIYQPFTNDGTQFGTPVSYTLDNNKHYMFCLHLIDQSSAGGALEGIRFRLDPATNYSSNVGNWTSIPSINGSMPITVALDKSTGSTDPTTFYVAGYGFDSPSNMIVDFNYYLGIEETVKSNERELIAYPNPAADYITVPFGEVEGKATVSIVDVAGRTVSTQVINLTGGNVTLDVTNIESGLYNFNVVYADGSSSDFKVVVNK